MDLEHAANSFGEIASTRDLVAELLAAKRSVNTRRAYEKDLYDFFTTMTGQEPHPALVREFLLLNRFAAVAVVLKYKAKLIDKGLKEATINRRLAAIKSLVNFARKVGECEWSLVDVEGEKVVPYRDTTGFGRVASENVVAMQSVLSIPDRSTPQGKRDYAVLRLLWDNALRRGEIGGANIGDFDPLARTLNIYGKGRGTQAQLIDLHNATADAISDWLSVRGAAMPQEPLFIALTKREYGLRLSGYAIYKLVFSTCSAAGIPKRISPHRIRHAAITTLLDASNGNTRMAQKLSRHTSSNVLNCYDDNRQSLQREASGLLAGLVR
ncbi:tyrosine-type recombinase/integrase [Microcoleus sp. ARI1-B5]|uniref:tyrosine-type recombinase/integrase n=1 Tax=unclassified Microcoleus TaxID=2642155 RepID=UPI002FD16BDB